MSILWIDDILAKKNLEFFPEELRSSIKIESQFFNAVRYINEHFGEFDTVVLDVNFEKGFGGDDSSGNTIKENTDNDIYKYINILNKDEDYFIKNAGYYLYIYLISKGFPSKRIAMLTANKEKKVENSKITDEDYKIIESYINDSDSRSLNKLKKQKPEYSELINEIVGELEALNDGIGKALELLNLDRTKNVNSNTSTQSVGEWEIIFSHAGIVAPKSFSKSDEIDDFRKWILGCYNGGNEYYWIRSIAYKACDYWQKEIDNHDIKFILEYNRMIAESSKALTYTDIKEMLRLIKSSFTLYKPLVVEDTYFQLLRSISIYFDVRINYQRKDRNLCIFYNIMELFRNWSSHNRLNTLPDSKQFIFILTIALRAYFRVNDKLLPYEENIIRLLSDGNDKVDLSEMKMKKEISRILFISIEDLYKNSRFLSQYAYQQLAEIGRRNDCCYEYLYRLLWHGIFNMDIDFRQQQRYVSISFKGMDRKDGFMKELLESTFYLAFKSFTVTNE